MRRGRETENKRRIDRWENVAALESEGGIIANTELLKICPKSQKKQQIFFGFTASCAAAGRRDIQL